MEIFTNILAKLQKKLDGEGSEKQQIITCIKEVVGVTLTPDMITYKEHTIRISAPATLKMAIQLKQKPLLEAFAIKHITVTSIN